jgi:hypothetical protein
MMIGTTRQGSARLGQQQLLHVHGRIGGVPTKTIDLGSAPSETVLGCQRARRVRIRIGTLDFDFRLRRHWDKSEASAIEEYYTNLYTRVPHEGT